MLTLITLRRFSSWMNFNVRILFLVIAGKRTCNRARAELIPEIVRLENRAREGARFIVVTTWMTI
jgi:hypothetical protein